jgi:hypothetical protein
MSLTMTKDAADFPEFPIRGGNFQFRATLL